MACVWRRSTSRLIGRCSTQGDVYRDRAAEQARAARRGPRGAGEGGAEGDCGVYRRVPFRRPAVLPAHRQGLRRIAVQAGDRRGRAWSAFAVKVPSTDRHLYAIDAGPAGRALPNGHSPVDETQVQTNETVVSFLRTCGEPNLQFLLQPKRLERALKVLDTSNDGEVDVDECTASGVLLLVRSTRRPLGGVAARFFEHPVHSLMCAQGRRRSTAASRSACSRCPRSARARRAPRRPRTRSSAPSFCRWPARSSR